MASTREFFRVEGLSDLDNTLKELPKATARSVLTSTLKTAAKPIQEAAAILAPDDPKTGGKDLHSSILISAAAGSRGKNSKESDVEVYIGPAKGKFYGLFNEFGTAFMGAHPFMRPAFDGKVMQTLNSIKDILADKIEKARIRLARKAEREAAKMK